MRTLLEAKRRASPSAEFNQDTSRRVKRFVEEENLQWAVSYSDLLMVLLSFFIVYFQFDDLKGINQQFLRKDISVSENSKGKSQGVPVPKTGTMVEGVVPSSGSISSGSGSGAVVEAPVGLPKGATEAPVGLPKGAIEAEGVSKDLALLCAQFAKLSRCKPASGSSAIILELSNDIYPPGEFELNSAVKRELQRIVAAFKDGSRSVNVTIIGNSDRASLSPRTQDSVGSNVALASLRAAKAANYLMENGIDEKLVFVQGANSVSRNSRSLSIVISDSAKEIPK